MLNHFECFLKEHNLQLSRPQIELCKVILDIAVKDKKISSLLIGGRRTGKTTVFKILDKFFFSIKVFDETNLINPYLNWNVFLDTSIQGADKESI